MKLKCPGKGFKRLANGWAKNCRFDRLGVLSKIRRDRPCTYIADPVITMEYSIPKSWFDYEVKFNKVGKMILRLKKKPSRRLSAKPKPSV